MQQYNAQLCTDKKCKKSKEEIKNGLTKALLDFIKNNVEVKQAHDLDSDKVYYFTNIKIIKTNIES